MASVSESQGESPPKRPQLTIDTSGAALPQKSSKSGWNPHKASELEKQRLQGNAFYYRKETEKVKPSTFTHHIRKSSDPMSGTTYRGTAASTIGNEPRLSDQPTSSKQPSPAGTTWSLFNASTPDLPSKKSKHDAKRRPDPLKLVPDSSTAARPSTRQQIEARDEAKLQKMMGMAPSEPSTPRVTFEKEESYHVMVKDLTRSGSKKDKDKVPRSPQKKVLGISIPFTRSKSPSKALLTPDSEDIPPLPFLPGATPKAHQVLGTSGNGGKRVPVPILKRPERSHTVSSLPQELFEKHDNDSDDEAPMPPVKFASTNTNARYKAATTKKMAAASDDPPQRPFSSSPPKTVVSKPSLEKSYSFPSPARPPPTPPKKDTPPHLKRENTQKLEATGLGIITGYHSVDEVESNFQRNLHPPASEGKVTAVKHLDCAHNASSSVVAKVPSVYSMHAAVESQPTPGQSRSAGFDPTNGFKTPEMHLGRWSEGQKEIKQRWDGLLPGGLLPPTCYYSPSVYSVNFETPKVHSSQKVSAMNCLSPFSVITPKDPTFEPHADPLHVS